MYGRQARISLVTVEREVRVYSLVVSDPMFRRDGLEARGFISSMVRHRI